MVEVLRYSAFTDDPRGGNPAGVVLDTDLTATAWMQGVASQVGYSETAFLRPAGPGVFDVRYFSPLDEVPFCGHATVAGAVALAERDGPADLVFATRAGEVPVATRVEDGALVATLTSVVPHVRQAEDGDVARALEALGWAASELDPELPPRVAFAGAQHLVLAAATRGRLADLDYAFDPLAALMRARDWTTVQLVWREDAVTHHARDPFPVGGVVEDPATGSAAAAYGAYLRELGLVRPPVRLTIHQGVDLGRASLLTVDLLAGDPRVRVSGRAVVIPPG